jgi:uncharacterized metal-binding protein YceD (DUF177 family)
MHNDTVDVMMLVSDSKLLELPLSNLFEPLFFTST